MKRAHTLSAIAIILSLMFFYAAYGKLINFEKSKQEMLNQIFPGDMALMLVWLVPFTELAIVVLLLIHSTRLKGFYASALLLTAFSLYISITMTGIFGRIPCSCGGILKHMSYWSHLIFNLIFIAMAVLGIAIEKQWKPIDRWFYFLEKKGGQSKLNK